MGQTFIESGASCRSAVSETSKEHVPIETVLCDREFDSMDVYQTLSNLGVNYLIPKRIISPERDAIETVEGDGRDVVVERTSVDVEAGSNSTRFLYVPSTKTDGRLCL